MNLPDATNHDSVIRLLQNLVLLGRRDARPRVRVHRDQSERDDGVPRVPLPEEKNGSNGDADCGAGFQHGLSGVAVVAVRSQNPSRSGEESFVDGRQDR